MTLITEEHLLNSHIALYYERGMNSFEMMKLIENQLKAIKPDVVIAEHVLALGPNGEIETSFGTVDYGEVIVHAPFIQEHQGFPLRAFTPYRDGRGVMCEFGYVEHHSNDVARTERAKVISGFTDPTLADRNARSSGKSPYCVMRSFYYEKSAPHNGIMKVSMWQAAQLG